MTTTNAVLALVLGEVVSLAAANEAQVLAGLSAESTSLVTSTVGVVENYIENIPALKPFKSFVGAAVQSALPQLIAQAGSEEKALYGLAIALLNDEIAKLK